MGAATNRGLACTPVLSRSHRLKPVLLAGPEPAAARMKKADPSLPFAPQVRPERKQCAALRVNARDDTVNEGTTGGATERDRRPDRSGVKCAPVLLCQERRVSR